MYYFDNKLLQGYIDQQKDLKAFDGQNWYSIADQSDLSDPITCIGYDVYGKDHRFDYRDITQIKVGNQTYTLEMLQKFYSGEEPEGEEKKPSKPSPSEEEPPEEEPEEKPSKEPELAHFSRVFDIGHQLIREAKKRRLRNVR